MNLERRIDQGQATVVDLWVLLCALYNIIYLIYELIYDYIKNKGHVWAHIPSFF